MNFSLLLFAALASACADSAVSDGASSQSETDEPSPDSVGEGGDCGSEEPPEEGFCVCEGCEAVAPVDCPRLSITCDLDDTGTTLAERCVDPVANNPLALTCILDHLDDSEPEGALVQWEVVLGDDPFDAYLARHPIGGTDRTAWRFRTNPGLWSTSGVPGMNGPRTAAESCLALATEEQPGCLHALLETLDPETCFEPVPQACA